MSDAGEKSNTLPTTIWKREKREETRCQKRDVSLAFCLISPTNRQTLNPTDILKKYGIHNIK